MKLAEAPAASWDPIWEELFQSQEWGKYPPESVIRFVARNWYAEPDRRAIRLLDLGCGTGACAWYMAREGFTIAGIDGSETAIRRGLNRMHCEGLQADLRVGDFTRLPWPDACFDGVVDNAALCTNRFEPTRRAIAEVHRVLKPGGRFLSCSFSDATWGYGTGREIEPGGFAYVTEGPIADKGFCRFMRRHQVDALYRDFERIGLEKIAWTLDNMQRQVEMWVVECGKTGIRD